MAGPGDAKFLQEFLGMEDAAALKVALAKGLQGADTPDADKQLQETIKRLVDVEGLNGNARVREHVKFMSVVLAGLLGYEPETEDTKPTLRNRLRSVVRGG